MRTALQCTYFAIHHTPTLSIHNFFVKEYSKWSRKNVARDGLAEVIKRCVCHSNTVLLNTDAVRAVKP